MKKSVLMFSISALVALLFVIAAPAQSVSARLGTAQYAYDKTLGLDIEDQTGGLFEDAVVVTLERVKDASYIEEHVEKYEYTIYKVDPEYGENKSYSTGVHLPVQGGLNGFRYIVSLSYPTSDKYAITYLSGADVGEVTVGAYGAVIRLAVHPVKYTDKINADSLAKTQSKKGYEEADALFIKLVEELDLVWALASDSETIQYDDDTGNGYFGDKRTPEKKCFSIFDPYAHSLLPSMQQEGSENYKKAMEWFPLFGGTEQDWIYLTTFDRLLYDKTFISIAMLFGSDSTTKKKEFEKSAESEAAFLEKYAESDGLASGLAANLEKIGFYPAAEAFRAVIKWQYAHYIETGSIYNFITREDWEAPKPEPSVAPSENPAEQPKTASQTKSEAKSEADELKQAYNDLTSELSKSEAKELQNALNEANGKKGGNIVLPVVIVGIVVVAGVIIAVVVIAGKKPKNPK